MIKYYALVLLLACFGSALTACQSSTPVATATVEQKPSATPTEPPAIWQLVGQASVKHASTVMGFSSPAHGITAGYAGETHYTTDGGATWPQADNNSYCRFGLEVVDDQVAWHCGNAGHVRLSTDGGKTWQAVTNFGPSEPAQCRFLSFLDGKTGWAATPTILGTTTDGARTWNKPALPEGIKKIAAIAVYASGQGYLLDEAGQVYSTVDDGATWTAVTPLDLTNTVIQSFSSPSVTMRFFDVQNGVVILSAKVEGKGEMLAFRTADGGQTWSREVLPVRYGTPFLSRDGRLLTIYTVLNDVYLFQYNGD